MVPILTAAAATQGNIATTQNRIKTIAYSRIMTVSKLSNYSSSDPQKLLLIYSLGALITAFLLSVVQRNFNEYFEIPERILAYLSLIAVCLCAYSTTCFIVIKANRTPFIKSMGIGNLCYCIVTTCLVIFIFPKLQQSG